MKTGTTELIKFKKLQRRWKANIREVVGTLEVLWLITQRNAEDGAIGRLSNEDIAAAVEWDGDPDEFIEDLVACKWLDRDPEFRLIVHDWSQHVPNFVKANYWPSAGRTKRFADQVARDRTLGRTLGPTLGPTLGEALGLPPQGGEAPPTKPNQALKPSNAISDHEINTDQSPRAGADRASPSADNPPDEGPIDRRKFVADFLVEWQSCKPGVRGVVHVAGLPIVYPRVDGMDRKLAWQQFYDFGLMKMSNDDKRAIEDMMLCRRDVTLEAVARIASGEITWDRPPIEIYKLPKLLDRLCAGAEVEQVHAERIKKTRGQKSKEAGENLSEALGNHLMNVVANSQRKVR